MALEPPTFRSVIATRFLLWQPRLDAGVHSIVDCDFSPSLRRAFLEHIATEFRELHDDDVAFHVDTLFASHVDLPSWCRLLLKESGIELTFLQRTPRVVLNRLGAWRTMTAWIDPDLLTTLALADSRGPAPEADNSDPISALTDWSYLLPAEHGPLEHILKQGTADTHVHLEGCDPAALLWLRVMSGSVRLSSLDRYSYRRFKDLKSDERAYDARRREHLLIEKASTDRKDLMKSHEVAPARASGDDVHKTDSGYMEHYREELRQERRFLYKHWRYFGECTLRDRITFDRYTFAKNRFLREFQQFPGSNPGLPRFRRYLDAIRPEDENRRRGQSKRLDLLRWGRMLPLVTETQSLNVLELRIAPLSSVNAYHRFFAIWARLLKDLRHSRQHPIEVRFVVHFIRRLELRESRGDDRYFGRLRDLLDRQTAVLQEYRNSLSLNNGCHIVGVDVANLERGSPPYLFAPAMRLLREGGAALSEQALDAFPYWSRLARRGRDRPPLHAPRLGMTFHAGEDFFHPIDGIRHIDSLVAHCLQPGDRIGHGLALGCDVTAFYRRRGYSLNIPKGVLLDNLCWVTRRFALAHDFPTTLRRDVDLAIESLSEVIYRRPLTATQLNRLNEARYTLPFATVEQSIGDLHREENTEPSCWKARLEPASREHLDVLAQLGSLIEPMQIEVLQAIEAKGVTIEANPSSNLATGGVADLAAHPLFHWLSALNNRVIMSINTDDPGVFATRLDVELALILEAMLAKSSFPPDVACDIIDKIRRTGLSSCFAATPSA